MRFNFLTDLLASKYAHICWRSACLKLVWKLTLIFIFLFHQNFPRKISVHCSKDLVCWNVIRMTLKHRYLIHISTLVLLVVELIQIINLLVIIKVLFFIAQNVILIIVTWVGLNILIVLIIETLNMLSSSPLINRWLFLVIKCVIHNWFPLWSSCCCWV